MSGTEQSVQFRCPEPAPFQQMAATSKRIDLIGEALAQGGLTVETSDPHGRLLLRTVFQLDGDVIFWVAQDCTRDGSAYADLVDRHWETVLTRTLAVGQDLSKLEDDARKWIRRVRTIGTVSSISGAASSIVSYLETSVSPVFILLAAATVFTFLFRRWGPQLIGRYVLRQVKSWVGSV